MMISTEKIDEVRGVADIVEIISGYVNLKRAANTYRGLCPFHQEKTPSFTVSPQKSIFHCFGCGVGGDVFKFVMLIEGYSFPEAIRELARQYGLEITSEPIKAKYLSSAGLKNELVNVLDLAKNFFKNNLWSEAGQKARAYLFNRGLNEEIARQFELGLSFDAWNDLGNFLKKQKIEDNLILQAGLIKENNSKTGFYDVFRNRVMLPIINQQAKTVAFGGRLWAEDKNEFTPKYMNSPETALYKKGELLYGYQRGRAYFREKKWLFIVEGYFDLIALVAAGINNVVATLGTAVTAKQLNLLRGQVKKIVFLFDPDEAGQRAVIRTLPLTLNAELEAEVIKLPPNYDPDSFLREFKTKGLDDLLAQAQPITEFYVDYLKSNHPDSVVGKALAAREINELLSQVPDSVKSQLLRNRLAQLLQVDPTFLTAFKKESENLYKKETKNLFQTKKERKINILDRNFLSHLIRHPEIANEFLIENGEERLLQPESQNLYKKLLYTLKQDSFEVEKLLGGSLDSLISEAVLLGRIFTPEVAASVAKEFWQTIEGRWLKKKGEALSDAIAEAQNMGNQEELERLFQEKARLIKL